MKTVIRKSITRRVGRPAPEFAPVPGPPRISLLVDHAIRDLSGMVLTAFALCRRGAVCYLTPFNLSEVELWRQVPDFVLLNYFRKNRRGFYRPLVASGIGIGVLDTEGGVLESVDTFAEELVDDPQLRAAVDCYCCWGPRLAEHLVEKRIFEASQVHVTGCPRVDGYAPQYRSLLRSHALSASPHCGNLILLNSNFSIGNPAFLTEKQQFDLLARQLGHEAEKVRDWQQREKAGMRQLAALANTVARRFPAATVVYRPHPFERIEAYVGLLEKLPNLHCLRTGSVDAWLMNASAVIQRSCSTSIEAGMAGSVALSPNWIPTPFERPAANVTSVPCDTEEQLLKHVGQILQGQYTVPETVRNRYHEVIRDWFYRVDGRAHQRVADVILDSAKISDTLRKQRQHVCRQQAYGLRRGILSKKRWRGALLAALDKPPSWSLVERRDTLIEPERFRRWRESSKCFTVEQVRKLLDLLQPQSPGQEAAVHVSLARAGKDYRFGYQQGCAIKLAPPGVQ